MGRDRSPRRPAWAGRRLLLRFAPLTVACLTLLIAGSAAALPVVVRTQDPSGTAQLIRDLGGNVTYVYRTIGAVSADVPESALAGLAADPRVEQTQRQHPVHRAIVESRLPAVPGYRVSREVREGREMLPLQTQPKSARPVPAVQIAGKTGPASFFGYDVLTGAAESWEATGYGEGVTVAIIDTGIYADHPAIAGNTVGGMNLVPADEERAIDHDGDSVPDNRAFDWNALENDSHGTFVAGVIAAHVDLEFPDDDPFVASVAYHSPESVVFDGEGSATVRILGQAPSASLFGVKVFPYDGGSAPDARVAEAIDRLVEMKRTGALDLDIINMSLSGPVLHDGWNPLDQAVDAATRAGITVVSAAANDGPSLLSVGSPGSAFTGLTVGGVLDPLHTRVAIEVLFGAPAGFGDVIAPHETPLMVDFASRGPTADRRVTPSLVATAFFLFSSTMVDVDSDGLNDFPGFGFASGTSFSAPAVAGAAALVTAYGDRIGRYAEAPYVAHALRAAARPIAEFKQVSQNHQGRGFVNVTDALRFLEEGRALMAPPVDPREANVADLNLRSATTASGDTPSLPPGGQFDFLVKIPAGASNLRVEFPVVNTSKDGNPVFGEVVLGAVHGAKRGGSSDYLFYRDGLFASLTSGDAVDIPYPEPGTARITVASPFTNYGPVSASVNLEIERNAPPVDEALSGVLTRDGMAFHEVEVPDGLSALAIRLVWRHDWQRFPTYDLDLYMETPDGFLAAASLDSPELAWIENPTAGTYRFLIQDFSTILETEPYRLELAYLVAEGDRGEIAMDGVRPRLEPALPNPARGSVELSFAMPRAEAATVEVFDVSGRLVRTVSDGLREAGRHTVRWDGRTDHGARAAAGVYFLRLKTEEGSSTRKVTLLK